VATAKKIIPTNRIPAPRRTTPQHVAAAVTKPVDAVRDAGEAAVRKVRSVITGDS
jgi:hypothetical protein